MDAEGERAQPGPSYLAPHLQERGTETENPNSQVRVNKKLKDLNPYGLLYTSIPTSGSKLTSNPFPPPLPPARSLRVVEAGEGVTVSYTFPQSPRSQLALLNPAKRTDADGDFFFFFEAGMLESRQVPNLSHSSSQIIIKNK